jgi:hypothetical protein
MKHTNKYAIQALKNEYADNSYNQQHYNRQYRKIVDALEMAEKANRLTIDDSSKIVSFEGSPSMGKSALLLGESFKRLMRKVNNLDNRIKAKQRYKPNHNRPRPNKGITPRSNKYRRELFCLKRVMTTKPIVNQTPITIWEYTAIPLSTGLDNLN